MSDTNRSAAQKRRHARDRETIALTLRRDDARYLRGLIGWSLSTTTAQPSRHERKRLTRIFNAAAVVWGR